MSSSDLHHLATYLAVAREQRGWTTRELAARSGIARSSIVRLEAAQSASPRPAVLAALARAFKVPLADLYLAAGIEPPQSLPTFGPYLRSKYAGLPADARREIQASFEQIADRYGYDAAGPAPGQDEN